MHSVEHPDRRTDRGPGIEFDSSGQSAHGVE
jgi:hypothetical protein